MAATVGSALLLTAPASHAATSGGSAGSCQTFSTSNSIGASEVTACPLADGSYQVTGYLDNYLPFGGLDGPYWAQVDIKAGTTRVGLSTSMSQYNVPVTRTTFDRTVSLPSQPTSITVWQPWR
ncbi:hypothetical protein AMK19_32365 [Kitasatospora sp. CB01950]|nr:hypothetical protein AMK19_32365 [Kitasatospora sp. CB01950]